MMHAKSDFPSSWRFAWKSVPPSKGGPLRTIHVYRCGHRLWDPFPELSSRFISSRAGRRPMPQFIVRVYRQKTGFRAVIDGVTHLDVVDDRGLEEVARRATLEYLGAAFPNRSHPLLDPDAVKTFGFEIDIRGVNVRRRRP
jgi:hypothetical protein